MQGNPDSGFREIFVESGILGFGIRNSALGIRNSTNDWNTESKTVLDFLLWGDMTFLVLTSWVQTFKENYTYHLAII